MIWYWLCFEISLFATVPKARSSYVSIYVNSISIPGSSS